MKVPTRLSVAGKLVRVTYVAELDDGDSYGKSHVKQLTIEIATNAHKSREAVFSTLFHELLHISLGITGQAELLGEGREEGLITAVENTLSPLLSFVESTGSRWKEISFPFDK